MHDRFTAIAFNHITFRPALLQDVKNLKNKSTQNQLFMKSKIRKISDWKTFQTSTNKHNIEILATHIAVIIGVFVFAAVL